jgi:aminoglycoside phosphotransferase (APT) family kinase protein
MSDQIVAPRTRDLAELGAQLTGWLAGKMPQARDLRVSNLDYPRGAGRSHETILFDLAWQEDGQERSEGFVVRVKPIANEIYPDDLFDEQYRIMQVMHRHRIVPVAETLWLESDPGIIGAPFFLMRKVNGRVPVSYPPYAKSGWVADASPEQRRRFWENGVRALADIQKTPLEAAAFLAGRDGLSGLEQEWDKFDRFVEWISTDGRWPVLDRAREILRGRWPRNQPQGLVWGDARIGNIMFDADFGVAAVVDWEQASLGGALHDLAWWLISASHMHGEARPEGLLEGMGSHDETIALWRGITGISTDDLDWYMDFTVFKTSCLAVSTGRVWGVALPDHKALAQRLGIAA